MLRAPLVHQTGSGVPRKGRMQPPDDALGRQLLQAWGASTDENEQEHLRRRATAIIAASSCTTNKPIEAEAIDIATNEIMRLAREERKKVIIGRYDNGQRLLNGEVRIPGANEELVLYPVLLRKHWVVVSRNRQQPTTLEICDSTNNADFRAELLAKLEPAMRIWNISNVVWADVEQQADRSNDCGLHAVRNVAKIIGHEDVWTREKMRLLCETQYERYTDQHTLWAEREAIPRRDGANPQTLTDAQVEEATRRLRAGDHIKVTWISENDDVTIWYGKAKCLDGKNFVNAVEYSRAVHGDKVFHFSDEATQEVVSETYDLPMQGVTYVSIERAAQLPQPGTVVLQRPAYTHRERTASDDQRDSRMQQEAEELEAVNEELAWHDDNLDPVTLGEATMPLGQIITDPFPVSDGLAHVARMTLGQFRRAMQEMPQQQEIHPKYVSAFATSNLTLSTRTTHAKLIRALEEEADETLQEMPLAEATLVSLSRRAKDRWAAVTLLKNAVQTQAALASLPLYRPTMMQIRLQASPSWRQAVKRMQKEARQSAMVRPPCSMLPTQHERGFATAPSVAMKAFLAMAWRSCARYGDITGLHVEDIEIADDNRARLTFRRGKAVTWRGPYSVHLALTQQEAAAVKQHIAQLRADRTKRLFADNMATAAMKHLKTIDDKLTQRSSRRGALQLLATTMTAVQLMQYSGHTNVATLRRYLAWGAVPTTEIVEGQQRQADALLNAMADAEDEEEMEDICF